MAETVTIFFATDIHGSERCFRKFVNAAEFFGANVLIMGGDITGKMVVPIVARGKGSYVARYGGVEHVAEPDKLGPLEDMIRRSGYYPHVTTSDEVAWLQGNPNAVDELFQRLISATLERWLAVAQERLSSKNVQIYLSPGNDDASFIDDVLRKDNFVVAPDGRVVWIRDWLPMINCGFSNVTPFDSPRELPEDELYRRLGLMASEIPDPGKAIFNVHVPPTGTPLDLAPLLTADLVPVVKNGELVFGHVGSDGVRRAIEKFQPLVGLHGHIHESRAFSRIGRTAVFNPGSEYGEGTLRGLILKVKPGKVVGHQFVGG